MSLLLNSHHFSTSEVNSHSCATCLPGSQEIVSFLDYEGLNTKIKFLLQKKIRRVYSEDKYVWSCSRNIDLGVPRFFWFYRIKKFVNQIICQIQCWGPQIASLEQSTAISDRFSTLSDGILAFTMANVTALFKICFKVLIVLGCHVVYLNGLVINSPA